MSTFWMTWPALEYVWSPLTVVSAVPGTGPVLLAPGRPPLREPVPALGDERDARGVVECDGIGEALADGLVAAALVGATVPRPTTPSAVGSASLLVCRKAG